jgi:hypothetical protein
MGVHCSIYYFSFNVKEIQKGGFELELLKDCSKLAVLLTIPIFLFQYEVVLDDDEGYLPSPERVLNNSDRGYNIGPVATSSAFRD